MATQQNIINADVQISDMGAVVMSFHVETRNLAG